MFKSKPTTTSLVKKIATNPKPRLSFNSSLLQNQPNMTSKEKTPLAESSNTKSLGKLLPNKINTSNLLSKSNLTQPSKSKKNIYTNSFTNINKSKPNEESVNLSKANNTINSINNDENKNNSKNTNNNQNELTFKSPEINQVSSIATYNQQKITGNLDAEIIDNNNGLGLLNEKEKKGYFIKFYKFIIILFII